MKATLRWLPGLVLGLLVPALASADPCGMVPPILTLADGSPPITRVGAQRTYVFYKEAIESFAIRPAFEGKVDEFGMLIPFPTPPSIKKVPDDVFEHLAKAVDPPEVVADLTLRRRELFRFAGRMDAKEVLMVSAALGDQEVNVLREEAVGMYDVAVLEAGSAAALKRWMEAHGYLFPTGMEDVCNDYVDDRWCFVAVKARVGRMPGVAPRPGMRDATPELPPGSTFDGAVQAMSFRFRTDELVVPMRLSAFNAGELHNLVYLLTDEPRKIRDLPESLVVRQVAGAEIYRNLTEPLPVRVIGGTLEDAYAQMGGSLDLQRRPEQHNGKAADLFAADLLSVREDRLSNPFEEYEKELLRISERLGLRGAEIDELHASALREELDAVAFDALADLKGMTLTVIDGDFDREVLARDNLRFDAFAMNQGENSPETYDAKQGGPAPERGGTVYRGSIAFDPDNFVPPADPLAMLPAAAFTFIVLGLLFGLLRRPAAAPRRTALLVPLVILGAAVTFDGTAAQAGQETARETTGDPELAAWLAKLPDPELTDMALAAFASRGEEAVSFLDRVVRDPSIELKLRGWAVVCLSAAPGDAADAAPWDGGALFLPSIAWKRETARGVVGELIRWNVWSVDHKPEELQKLRNALVNVGLVRTAEISISWGNLDDARPLLRAWGAACGRSAVEEILAEQGLIEDERYASLLAQLR